VTDDSAHTRGPARAAGSGPQRPATTGAQRSSRLRPRLAGPSPYRLLGSMWGTPRMSSPDAMVRWLRTDRSQVREPARVPHHGGEPAGPGPAALGAGPPARTYTGAVASGAGHRRRHARSPRQPGQSADTLSLATLRLMEELTPPRACRSSYCARPSMSPTARSPRSLTSRRPTPVNFCTAPRPIWASHQRRTEADQSRHAELLERLLWAAGEGELSDLEELAGRRRRGPTTTAAAGPRAALVPVVGNARRSWPSYAGLRRRFGPTSYAPPFIEVNGQPGRPSCHSVTRMLSSRSRFRDGKDRLDPHRAQPRQAVRTCIASLGGPPARGPEGG